MTEYTLSDRIARFRELRADLRERSYWKAVELFTDCQKRITELQQENNRLNKLRLDELQELAAKCDSAIVQRERLKKRIEELAQEIKLRCDLHGDCERENERLHSEYRELERVRATEHSHEQNAASKDIDTIITLKAQLESAKDEWTKESGLHTAKAKETLALYEAGRKQLESAEALMKILPSTPVVECVELLADYFAKKEAKPCTDQTKNT